MNSDWLNLGLLARVREIVRPWSCCLVGGAVRDHLLGRAAHDLDLVTAGDGELTAALARELPARLVPIGGDRFAATRLVGEDFVIDVWDRGRTPLDTELARRDLTLNAMAVDLADGTWHDPHGGRRDLAARRLRATTDLSFADDPLRVLRLARLAAGLPDFTVEPRTLELARAALPALSRVAAERRREEFGRSLRAQSPARALAVWTTLGFYPGVAGTDDGAAAASATSAFERADAALRHFAGQSADLSAEPAPQPDALILHAALLLDVARADVQTLVAGGYVSRREARDLALVLDQRRLPEATTDQRWLLHRASHAWATALCFAAAADAETPRKTVLLRLEACIGLANKEGEAIFNPAPLLRGNEIRELLSLESGPEVGLASRRLRRRQIEGRLRDREHAASWLLSERRSSGAD